jgi:hypothetical protein
MYLIINPVAAAASRIDERPCRKGAAAYFFRRPPLISHYSRILISYYDKTT